MTTTAATETRGLTWLEVVRIAATVIVVWAVVLQVTAGVIIPPVLVVGIAFAALLAFLRSGRRWVGLLAAALGLVSVTGNIPSLVEELSHPSSALAFTLTLVAAAAALVLVVAGFAVFFGWSASPTDLLWGWAGVVAAGAVASFIAAAAVESLPASEGDVVVVAKSNRFAPDRLTVAEGRVAVWVDNRDGARHTFTAPGLGVDLEIVGLKSQRVEFAASPGEYVVFCTVVGHEDMVATLVVG